MMNSYSEDYIEFLVCFHSERDYFECHEIGEECWKKENNKEIKDLWLLLIKIAVACYHHRRGNFNGTEKTLAKTLSILEQQKNKIKYLGIDYKILKKELEKILEMAKKKQKYESFFLPITDNELIKKCLLKSKEKKLEWHNTSDLSNDYLIHKHKKRDRSEVLQERTNALLKKNK